MNAIPDPVDAIFARYGVPGPWAPLPATGVANRIYATEDVVLRVATDHPEGVSDARTESVAAPVARAAGILTPRLIAFDDSRTLVARPFSLWERVRGETLGLIASDPLSVPNTWRMLGCELAALHTRVRECPDPLGYLDHPERELPTDLELGARVEELVSTERMDASTAHEVQSLLKELRPSVEGVNAVCFVHNDIHEMNVMCTRDDSLLAIIDWGDAGWGDPAIDFTAIPLAAIPIVLEGYELEAPGLLGQGFEKRIIWDKLHVAMRRMLQCRPHSFSVDQSRAFLRSPRK